LDIAYLEVEISQRCISLGDSCEALKAFISGLNQPAQIKKSSFDIEKGEEGIEYSLNSPTLVQKIDNVECIQTSLGKK
jgi:hypothetical protein